MMDNDYRQAIMRSAESFVTEYDPNENRRVDLNTAINLVKKLKIIKKDKECSICFDSVNSNKISKLPCCKNKICQPCIINTITYNTKDCPMCRKDLVETINTTNMQQSTDSDNEIETPTQPQLPTIRNLQSSSRITSITRNITTSVTKYKLKKCQPTSYKDPDYNTSIRTQKYTFVSETNNKSKSPIEIIYHNNSEINRRRFESFLKDYKIKLEYGKILDEPKTWAKLCNITYTFTDKHKYSPNKISDSIINNLYEKLNILVNTNTVI
jgi:hypothetical protein